MEKVRYINFWLQESEGPEASDWIQISREREYVDLPSLKVRTLRKD